MALNVGLFQNTDYGTRAPQIRRNAQGYRRKAMDEQQERIVLSDLVDKKRQQDLLNKAYEESVMPDGSIDEAKMTESLYQGGGRAQLPGVKSGFDAQREEKRKAGRAREEESRTDYGKKLEIVAGRVSRIIDKPDLSHNDVNNEVQGLFAAGALDEEDAHAALSGMPKDPKQLKSYLRNLTMEALKEKDRWDAMNPKIDPGVTAKYVADSTAATARRGQDKSAATARYSADKAVSGRETATAKPVKTTEDERKSAGQATRMEGSLRTLTAIEKTNPRAVNPGFGTSVTNLLPEGVANYMRSGDRQRVEAAQLDALDAALSLATGAAYTKEQMESLKRAYFAQPGDDPQTVKEKAARLALVIKTARIRASGAEPNIDAALGAKEPASTPPNAPKKGAIVDGYIFKGGDPSKESSWQKR